MTAETLFISDLHLDEERPKILSLFLTFLAQRAPQAERLFILGDLFETWIGDDDDTPVYQVIKDGLKQLSTQIPVFIMQGNRDFLLGETFAQETGCSLLPETHLIDLYGIPTLLMHGDTLCTEDTAYLQLRQILRNPLWQQDFLSKSLEQRRFLARQLRAQSQAATQEKSTAIMDANPQAVLTAFQTHDVQYLIHGHTHRPNIHALEIQGKNCKRLVLGDWYTQGSLLMCDSTQNCRLQCLD